MPRSLLFILVSLAWACSGTGGEAFNAEPEAEITAPTGDGVYYSDQLIPFEGVVSDAEDEATDLVVAWASDLDGKLDMEAEPDDDGEFAVADYLTEGEHVLTLTATDTTEEIGSDTVTVIVGPPNSAPTCGITAPETNSADEEGTKVLFEATVADVDVPADWLTVAWSSDLDGDLGESTPDSSGDVAFSYSELSIESHVITLTVTDEVGADCSDEIIYSVGTPPSISIEAPTSGDVVDEGDVVGFQATISDGEDAATDLSLSWESNLDGEFSTQGSDSTGAILFTESGLSTGAHTITATVTDIDGLYAQGEVLLQVNAIPTAPEVELSPDPATTGDDLVVTITSDSTDADGDPVSYSYAWYVDGVPSTASTSSTLSSAETTRDQTWTVEVTPNDGYSDGPAGSDDRTIDNTAPEVSDVEISPASATVNDQLSCSYTVTDADGDADASTIEWDIDGSTAGTGETLSSGFAGGSVVTCTVTPDDGSDTGTPVSDSIYIDNTAPVLTSVELGPDPAYEGYILTCTPGETTDADGTTSFTYSTTWTVDGSDPGETSDTLSSDFFDRDQEVLCYATPNDGTDDGDEVASNAVTIENTAPSIDSVAISPDPAVASDALSCSYSGWADADGDVDSDTTYAWAINGSDVSTGTILSTGYVGGDTVTCTVSPDDGDAEGTALSTSAVIENTPPVLTDVDLSPEPAYEGDTLTCTPGDVEDDDGTTSFTFSYAWTVDGSDPGATGATLSSAYFDRDQEVLCYITPNDGVDDGDTFSSNAVTISNTPPTAPVVALGEEETRPGDPLVCEILVEATDIDTTAAATYAFTWYQDSTEYTGTVTNTTLPGDTVPIVATTTGEVWTCSVTATIDGAEATAEDWTEIVNLRPEDAPDWWIFSISGHCASCPNELNPEYLESNTSSTLDLVHATMEGYGFTVESFAYSDEFYSRDSSLNTYHANAWLSGHDGAEPTGSGWPDSWGFLQVVSDMEYIRDNWQSDFEDPTRVMFLAHSHGDVWAHQAFRTVEDLDIEIAIDLDGYSSFWSYQYWWTNYGDEWGDVIDDHNDTYGTSYWDEAYSSWYVDGLGYEDVEDVLPQDNVTYCLEVQASDTWSAETLWINDDDDNHRPDGSTTGISTYYSSSQDHAAVIEPSGDAMDWVISELEALYSP